MSLSVETLPSSSPRNAGASSSARSTGKRPSLRLNVIWILAGNIASSASQWGILLTISQFGGTDSLGLYALVAAVCQPIFAFCSLHLRDVQVTDVCADFTAADYLTMRILTTAAAGLITLIIAVSPLSDNIPVVELLIFSLILGIDAITDMLHGQLQQQEAMSQISTSMVLRSVTSWLAFTVGYCVFHQLSTAMLALTAARLMILAGYDVPLFRSSQPDIPRGRFRFTGNPRTLLKLAQLSLPFAVSAGLLSLRGSIPRLFIWHYCSERELGVFTAIASTLVPFHMLLQAIYQSAFPRLAKYFAQKNFVAFRHLLQKITLFSTGMVACIGLGAFLVGEPLIKLLYRIEADDAGTVVIGLSIAAACQAAAKPAGLTARTSRSFAPQLCIQTAGILLLSAMSSWLVSTGRLVGAASACAATGIVTAIALIWVVIRQLKLAETAGSFSTDSMLPQSEHHTSL